VAKESGLGMTVTIDDSGGTGRNISNDITSISFSTPQGLIDVTGLDKSAKETIIGLADGTISLTAAFNDAAGASSFDVFKTRTGSRTCVIAISGQTLTMEMYIATCDWSRGNDGALNVAATLQLNSGTVPAWA
jgi:hypothetical protein